MKKSTMLRNMINRKGLSFIMEAHNGLSAKIVEEAGFEGIWASGLSISASLGVRDNNEASWTQVLDVLEFMSDASTIPILLDGDTGYGNFNNMRRLIKKLIQRNIAGVCIEDKLFPKTNSFIDGEAQPLADMEEFCGKIRAAKDEQASLDPDFVVVARIEAFIAGWGVDEAIRRAQAYADAGADAILVHSKKSTDSDIVAFMERWDNRKPIVIVPTKYYSVPTAKFEKLGISLIIWANHNLRSAIEAMKTTSERIFKDRSLINVEDKIVKVSEVFRLQGADELKEAEKKYLPASGKKWNAIILAASQGSLGDLTKDTPKTMLQINGNSILGRQISLFNSVGIKFINVVRGFGKEKITFTNVSYTDNDDYKNTKELYSLWLARESIANNTIISFGDIVFKGYVLNELMNDDADIVIVADAIISKSDDKNRDFIVTDKKFKTDIFDEPTFLKRLSYDSKGATGEFIGILKTSAKGGKILLDKMAEMSKRPNFKELSINDALNEITAKNPVKVKFITGSWSDIDTIVDLQSARE